MLATQAPYPKPLAGTGSAPAVTLADPVTVPPVVSCPGPSCDFVSQGTGGATTQPIGLNARDSGLSYGLDVEPGDYGLCAGNGYVMEYANIGELQLFNERTLAPGPYITLDNLMGLTTRTPLVGTTGWSSGGDEAGCLYDYNNGGHWFVTEAVSETSWSVEGPFGGCFIGVPETCLIGIAVSVTNNPMGSWNIYFFDPNNVNTDPGQGYLLNDFGHIGNTRDALLLTYDEFNLNATTYPACPAFGCEGFNGAQAFAFNKNALELGLSTSSPYFNFAYENMGNSKNLYPIPANPPFQPSPASCYTGEFAGAVCWYAVMPAQSPGLTQYDNSNGGTGFMLGALDEFGLGDNRIGVFDWTGLSNLLSPGCFSCRGVSFGGQLLTGLEAYMDEGAPCLASSGGVCGLGTQKAGPIPLGDNCEAFGLTSLPTTSCPENGIQTDGDFFTQVSYAQGQLWGAIPTLITQQYNYPSSTETHVGAAYWVVGTSTFDFRGTFTLTGQGYVSAMHEDIEMPAIGAGGAAAVMVFSLSGPNYYPSTAFGELTATSDGLSSAIHIADRGMAPQDGFTEYLGYPPAASRPRWGDFFWATYDPVTNLVYFGSGYIQYPACSASTFLTNPTCGGTRDPYANWGTSVNSITPGFP